MRSPADNWHGRRVLVTGATGVIGSWLVRKLLDEGASVIALVVDPDPQTELYRSGTVDLVTVVLGRLEDERVIERCITHHATDTVFHLGAQTLVGVARRAPVSTFESNIQGTWNLLEACRRHAGIVERIVVASSDKAYGEQELPYREEMSLKAGQPYEVSKACADLIAQSYFGTYGLPVGIARLGNVYGGGDLNWSRLVPGTIRSLLEEKTPVIRSDGSYIRDFIFVKDAVGAYLSLAQGLGRKELHGEGFNFSSAIPMTVMQMYDAISSACGIQVEPEVKNAALDEIHDQYLRADKAERMLGWKTEYSIEEGLSETVDWYRDFLHKSSDDS